MKKALLIGALMLTASEAFAQYSTGTVGEQSFMMNTFQNEMGSYSTGTIGGQSFGITTFDPPETSVDPLPMPPDDPLPPMPNNTTGLTGITPEEMQGEDRGQMRPQIAVPHAWMNRMRTCEKPYYFNKHAISCTADWARFVVHLYIFKNEPVTSEMNSCQYPDYVSINITNCLTTIREHQRKILVMVWPNYTPKN